MQVPSSQSARQTEPSSTSPSQSSSRPLQTSATGVHAAQVVDGRRDPTVNQARAVRATSRDDFSKNVM
ncbi:hypothetical protein D7X32_29400 [Corallococcus carmarthensis]|uniref:Uncharacterized protein n=1 Tax=Corallococcus carmarthensis TaxID=2316728 RepID=A0A3A8JU81_9BACT|nr:hypothetical protein D7X32_29400 [Corallococcus carmarthensis]